MAELRSSEPLSLPKKVSENAALPDLNGLVDDDDILMPRSARAVRLLAHLRGDTKSTDATVEVAGTKFAIHRAIVASLSPFFSTALYGGFAETHSKTLVLQGASPEAVSVLLDYAYAMDVEKSFEDLNLALNVWKLAHQYFVRGLRKRAAVYVLQHPTFELCIPVLQHSKMYGSRSEVIAASNKLAAQFALVSDLCPDFGNLSFEDLLGALSSRELIASEYEKFRAIAKWATDSRRTQQQLNDLVKLFSNVRFQRFKKHELSEALKDSNVIPVSVLTHALRQTIQHSANTPGLLGRFEERFSGAAEFVLSAIKNTQDRPTDDTERFYFTYNQWAMSAYAAWLEDKILVTLTFDHRLIVPSVEDYALRSFQEDLSNQRFTICLRKVANGRCGNIEERFRSARHLHDNAFKIELSLREEHFRISSQLSILVHIFRTNEQDESSDLE